MEPAKGAGAGFHASEDFRDALGLFFRQPEVFPAYCRHVAVREAAGECPGRFGAAYYDYGDAFRGVLHRAKEGLMQLRIGMDFMVVVED